MKKALFVVGIGCSSLVLLTVVAVAGVFMWAAYQARQMGDPTPSRVERTIAVGERQAREPAGDPDTGSTKANARTGSRNAVRLDVDLTEGSFTIEAGPPGSEVTVDGEWPEGYYELIEQPIPETAPGGPGVRIRFASSASFFVRMVGRLVSGQGSGETRLTLRIPEDLPVDLSLRIGLGEARVDLGGLTLTGLRTELTMGNHELDFSRPVARDVDEIDLEFNMGNVTVANLGNARAARIEADGRMGSLVADLGGEWRPGSVTELTFTQSMGEARFRVPKSVRLMAATTESGPGGPDEPSRVEEDEPARPDAPVVKLNMRTSMGDSRISRY